PNAKFMCLGDYANSRGAADMGLYPNLLPGYAPLGCAAFTDEYQNTSTTPGLDIPQMFAAAKSGALGALYVVGANPIADYNVDPSALQNTFVVVQELFLTETAMLAEVVLPAASAYEKSGTFTNTYGDLQLLKKAGDVTGVRTDFEMIVRVADRLGADIRKLVPFGKPMRADTGQSRGAQMGEADRHGVWLASKNIEPKLSPFDPAAMLDEIQRLVPGYANISRLALLSGSDTRTDAVGEGQGTLDTDPTSIVPADDTLFTSGTLGRYSNTLNSVIENRRRTPASAEIMAD
ncbi:MAG: molybdopterin-dependent oxidoreductase, partial [Acidobacteriales bacterium]|nr:molybdopterin-dependent oxidoreductase [Terriglobales bacterium]